MLSIVFHIFPSDIPAALKGNLINRAEDSYYPCNRNGRLHHLSPFIHPSSHYFLLLSHKLGKTSQKSLFVTGKLSTLKHFLSILQAKKRCIYLEL
jgi:hypothetical protein